VILKNSIDRLRLDWSGSGQELLLALWAR